MTKRKTNRARKSSVTFIDRITQLFKQALVPHKSNAYQPHLIRRYGIIVILALVIGTQLITVVDNKGAVLGQNADLSTSALLSGNNQARQNAGLLPMRINAQLTQAAKLKSNDMFARQYWAHTSPDGTPPWRWIRQAGYTYDTAGENLAKNFYTAESTTTAWMASAEHRKNILGNDYKDVGFAVTTGELDGKKTTIVVALYGAPSGQTVAGAQTFVAGADSSSNGVIGRLGTTLQRLNPALLGYLALLLFASFVALAAHSYRSRLPKRFQVSWYRLHGLIKASGMMSLMIVIVFLYSGGQI